MYEATVTVENKHKVKGLRTFEIPFIMQFLVFSPPFHFTKNVVPSVFPSSIVMSIATTQPTKQIKTKQFGWSGIIIGKKNHTTTPPPQCDYILSHFQAT